MDIFTETSDLVERLVREMRFQNLVFVRRLGKFADDEESVVFDLKNCKVTVRESGNIVIRSEKFRRSLSALDFPEPEKIVEELGKVLSYFDQRYPDFTAEDYVDEFALLKKANKWFLGLPHTLQVLLVVLALAVLYPIFFVLKSSVGSFFNFLIVFVLIVVIGLLRGVLRV